MRKTRKIAKEDIDEIREILKGMKVVNNLEICFQK